MPGKKDPVLVVLQLTGGNDALNTLVPYSDPRYYDARPNIAIAAEDVLPLNERFGLHPSMGALKSSWDAGNLAVIPGVGHDHTNYSHFRSLDIWSTAEPAKVIQDGWLGKTVRALDPSGDNVLSAINIGYGLPRALSLRGVPVASVAQVDAYGLLTHLSGVDERNSVVEMFSCMYEDGADDRVKKPLRVGDPADPRHRVLPYLGRTGLDAKKGSDIIGTATVGYRPAVDYPKTAIANNLKAIAQLHLAGLGTRIFYTQHGGYDTHANQLDIHSRLLKELAESVDLFLADLRAHDAADEVVVLVFSEFGRRVADNGSASDHGAAGVAFVLGPAVKGGIYGEFPSLDDSDLEIGNLRRTNDFRSTYATLLETWLAVESDPVVNGRFEQFAFLAGGN